MTIVDSAEAATNIEPPGPVLDPGNAWAGLAIRRLWHPLTAICALQALLSLTLVWSNTAFADEAEYLWLGRTLLASWLHGTTWPQYERGISGSQVIYPPLGAIAASIGGLAAARILSLVFMLGATVLLYLTASRLISRTGALFAAALWALSAPVVRLAFATFDPLSVLLTAISAWLVVQALYRRRPIYFVAGSALALALANATAYSGIVIDPVVIGFAVLVWRWHLPLRRLLAWIAVLVAGCALAFGVMLTLGQSWVGLETISSRSAQDHQSYSLVLNDIWKYSGFVIALAVIGSVAALITREERVMSLLVFAGCAAFVVPAAQVLFRTGWALDKHLAYGIWFGVIAGGYGCSKLIGWLPETRLRTVVVCCVLALTYPAINGWESAWAIYHEWADSRPFVAALKPAAAQSRGLIDAAVQVHIAEYYTPQGADWSRWSAVGLSLDPVRVPQEAWRDYYTTQLHHKNFGVIAMFYAGSSSGTLTGSALSGAVGREVYQELISSPAYDPGQPGLQALTEALEHDAKYRLVAEGPFNTSQSGTQGGVFAIWERVART